MNAIEVRNISKRYRIGLVESDHRTFAGQLVDMVKAPFNNLRKLRSLSRFEQEDESVFWALRDISFDVKEGEVLGIIGHNGAGKSTLLKILSRITEPTGGEITIKGRVSSLLEVGTGFHPDLTGRENIYMNGTILGMKKREIDTRFDEIVAFSGVEKYIDTPVKRYSSGMKVRLAFSVAAHLEPEVLIIDEVLAVGDAEFQAKCLGKMEDVASKGRTVLFVSHNMTAVSSLCSNTIILSKGSLIGKLETSMGIRTYLTKDLNQTGLNVSERKGSGVVKISSISISHSLETDTGNRVICGQEAFIIIHQHRVAQSLRSESIVILISDSMGNLIFTLHTRFKRQIFENVAEHSRILCRIDRVHLLPGEYYLSIRCIVDGSKGSTGELGDSLENAITFAVFEGNYFDTGEIPRKGKHGFVAVEHDWQFENIVE